MKVKMPDIKLSEVLQEERVAIETLERMSSFDWGGENEFGRLNFFIK